jgi:hypothetical protein
MKNFDQFLQRNAARLLAGTKPISLLRVIRAASDILNSAKDPIFEHHRVAEDYRSKRAQSPHRHFAASHKSSQVTKKVP